MCSKMTIKSFRHVGIVTKNIDASIAFYNDLGFNVYWDQNETSEFINIVLGEEIEYLRTVKMNNGEFSIELLDFKRNNKVADFTITSQVITHISVDTEDIDILYSKYSRLFKSKPQITNDKKAKVAFMKDPNNSLFIEVVEMI